MNFTFNLLIDLKFLYGLMSRFRDPNLHLYHKKARYIKVCNFFNFIDNIFLCSSHYQGDVHFDPYNTGKEKMPFIRTTFSG